MLNVEVKLQVKGPRGGEKQPAWKAGLTQSRLLPDRLPSNPVGETSLPTWREDSNHESIWKRRMEKFT